MNSAKPNLIAFQPARDAKGPDGQGWNRLSINTVDPTDRCKLRPTSRQAALDLGRGMAAFGCITTFAPCEGSKCAGCAHNREREQWVSSWVLSEDKQRGGVWLMGSRKPDAQGHFYSDWHELSQHVELPHLTRVMDPHWGAIYIETGVAQA